MKEDEMGYICGTHGGRSVRHIKLKCEYLKQTYDLRDFGAGRRKILILQKYGLMMWNGFI
jgi:hypothetical protein